LDENYLFIIKSWIKILKKSSVLDQDLENILQNIVFNLDEEKGGYKGAPKFPIFNIYDTFFYFFTKTKNLNYFHPFELVLKQFCSQGIYDHVEGGLSSYTVDENWLIPHFEKMLYDNAQFILLLSKYCKLNTEIYFKEKLEQTIEFLKKTFLNKSGFLGSVYDADSDGEEGKDYVYAYEEIKDFENIGDYFEIESRGNWENKIILIEKKLAPQKLIKELKNIRLKRRRPFFDKKNQLDLNCLWISSLLAAHEILPEKKYLKFADRKSTRLNSSH